MSCRQQQWYDAQKEIKWNVGWQTGNNFCCNSTTSVFGAA